MHLKAWGSLLLGIILFGQHLVAQESYWFENDVRFHHLTIEDGLSNPTVTRIIQDSRGFMWIGTRNGLNVYDGKSFSVFTSGINSEITLPETWISELFEDSHGNIWIGLNTQGLARYNPNNGEMTLFRHNPVDPRSLSYDHVFSIVETPDEKLWIATYKGISIFDPKSEQFEQMHHNTDEPNSLSQEYVSRIAVHPDGTLWMSYWGTGISRYWPKIGVFEHFNTQKGLPNAFSRDVFVESPNKVWIGTNNGLALLDPETGRIQNFGEKNGLGSPSIRRIFQDDEGVIWIATNSGLSKQISDKSFVSYEHKPTDDTSILGEIILEITSDREGNLWTGSFNGGVSIYDKSRSKFSGIGFNPLNPPTLVHPEVTSVLHDKYQRIWVATSRGLQIFGPKGSEKLLLENSKNEVDNRLTSITQNRDFVFAATSRAGIFKIDKKNLTVSTLFAPNRAPYNGNITHITIQSDGNLWIGTQYEGLWKYGADKKFTLAIANSEPELKRIHHSIELKDGRIMVADYSGILVQKSATNFERITIGGSIVDFGIPQMIDQDANQNIWIASSVGGIFKLNNDYSDFRNWKEENGLVSNNTTGIVVDHQEKIWISTQKGLSLLSSDSESFQNFDHNDGLLGNQFSNRALFLSDTEWLLAGGMKGLNIIQTSRLKESPVKPIIAVTNVSIDGNSILPRTVKTFEISPDQNEIFFEFAVLDFTNPKGNMYSYKLEPGQSSWSVPQFQGNVRFANLGAGNFTLFVHGANSDGIWSENVEKVSFVVLPPFWKTWWFQVIVFIMFVGFIFSWNRTRAFRFEQRQKELEFMVGERTRDLANRTNQLNQANSELQKSREIADAANQAKSNFLAGMSHELRTPLNAILGFSELLSTDSDMLPRHKNHIETMFRSGRHLLSMINDVLDLSKIEAGRIDVRPELFDPLALFDDLRAMFAISAQKKHLEISFTISDSLPKNLLADQGKIRQILINIIGNALKFTDKGSVKVKVDFKNGFLLAEVSDTGKGMTKVEILDIFEPFTRADSASGKPGTGLGMAISKRLADLMGGSLTIESEPDNGTRVSLLVPAESVAISHQTPMLSTESRITGIKGKKALALVVDDVSDNRELLFYALSAMGFSCEMAVNGLEAVEKAIKLKPDAIFMDLAMPKMRGDIALVEIRKAMENPPPILAVTASTFERDQQLIIEKGFTDFLLKPISLGELHAKILKHVPLDFIVDGSLTEENSASSLETIKSAIERLPEKMKKDLLEAVEFNDLNGLKELAQSINDESLQSELLAIADNKDFKKLLELQELIGL